MALKGALFVTSLEFGDYTFLTESLRYGDMEFFPGMGGLMKDAVHLHHGTCTVGSRVKYLRIHGLTVMNCTGRTVICFVIP